MSEAKEEMFRRKTENARMALAQRLKGKTRRKQQQQEAQANVEREIREISE
eukprot:SAG11_NODE_2306_length_3546_cov_2.802147_1_plen_51_part_00